jgi:hypothetical protein
MLMERCGDVYREVLRGVYASFEMHAQFGLIDQNETRTKIRLKIHAKRQISRQGA